MHVCLLKHLVYHNMQHIALQQVAWKFVRPTKTESSAEEPFRDFHKDTWTLSTFTLIALLYSPKICVNDSPR